MQKTYRDSRLETSIRAQIFAVVFISAKTNTKIKSNAIKKSLSMYAIGAGEIENLSAEIDAF